MPHRSPTAAVTTSLAALGAVLVAAFLAVAATVPDSPGVGRLGLDGLPLSSLAHVLTLAGSVAALGVARGLWRGTRRAAMIAAGVLTAVAAVALAHGHAVTAGGAVLAAGLLAADRRSFSRGAATTGTGGPAMLTALAATGAWATAGAALLIADQVTGLTAAARAAGGWLLDGSWWLHSDAPVAVVLDVLVLVALAAGTQSLRRALRPSVAHEGHTAADHGRAAAIVTAHAAGSLDPFALREDKAFHFAAGGFLAYRTLRGTAVVSGDPIGPPGSAPQILASFHAEARRRGWDVVLTGADSRHLDGYRDLGFRTLCIGEEAVVDPATFTLDGGAMKTVRKAVGRQRRRGWTVDVIPGDALDDATVAELDAVDRAWRTGQGRLTGFAMTLGRLWGAAEDAHSLYVTGTDPEGTIRAFVRFARYDGGLSLDVMRRCGETPNGLTETLVVAAIEHARGHGMSAVSLNFAGFAHVMGTVTPATRRLRIVRWLLARNHDRFQLERLVVFNDKFRPRWEPRYLVHQGSRDLPLAGLRVLQAEAYLRSPRTRPLTARWQPCATPVGLAVARAGPPPR